MSKQDNMAEAPLFPGGPDADSSSLEEVGREFRGEPAGPTMSESRMTPETTIGNERGTDRENAGEGRVMLDEEATSTAGHLHLFGIAFPQRGQNTRTFQGQVQATGIASGNSNVLKTNPIEPSPPPTSHDAEEGQELDTLNETPRVEVERTLLPQEVSVTQQSTRVQKQLSLDVANSGVHSTPKVVAVPHVLQREPNKENEVNLGNDRAVRANHELQDQGFETLAGTVNQLESRHSSTAIDEEREGQLNFNIAEQEHPRAQNGLLDSFEPQNAVLQETERCEPSHEDTNPKDLNVNHTSSVFVRPAQDESEVNLRDIRATLTRLDKQQQQVDTQQNFSNRVIEVESPPIHDDLVEAEDLPGSSANDPVDPTALEPEPVLPGVVDPSSMGIEDQGERSGDDDQISNQQHSETKISDGQDDRNNDSNDVSGELDMPGSHQSPEENAEFANDGGDAMPGVEHSVTPPNEVDGQSSGNAKHDNEVGHAASAAEHLATSSNQRPQIGELALELQAETLRSHPDIASLERNLYALCHINLVDLYRYFYNDRRNSIPPAINEIQRRILLFNPDEKETKQSESLMPRHSQVGPLLSHSAGPPPYQVPVPVWGQKEAEKRITNPTDDCNAFHYPVPGKEVPDQLNGSNNNNLANPHDNGRLLQIFQLRRNLPPDDDVLPQIPGHAFPAQLNIQHQQEVNGDPAPEDVNGQNLAGMGPGNDRVEVNPEMPPEVCLRCRAALGYAEHQCPADAMQDDVHAVGDANQQPENPGDVRAFNDANP